MEQLASIYIIARVCLAAIFVYSGVDKFLNWQGVIAECKAFKLPFLRFVAAATIALHIIGGLCLIFGIAVFPVALALAAFTFLATLLAHNFWTQKGETFGRELTTALEHLGIVGGLILLGFVSKGF